MEIRLLELEDDMRKMFLLSLAPLFCTTSFAADCCGSKVTVGYIEETVVVKKPVLIKQVPIIETREKQVTVKEQVVVGYKEEIVDLPVRHKKLLLRNLFKKQASNCDTCN